MFVGNLAGQASRNHVLLIWLQDRPNSGRCSLQARPIFLSVSKKCKSKIERNTISYKAKFIQHKKYNIRWAFCARVQRHCAVPIIKVKKGTNVIWEISSLIRHMYILRYIVIRTNQYIVMHNSRELVYYRGAMECISWCYRVPIRTQLYITHTTRLYNTPIKHKNKENKRKRKTSFDWRE